ncbi:M1 family metallopeptidase [Henriciella aquimarina]|uniref:M1 family metallopeptidase n=1 Tax=Henriciella aquimarina TaxID=545261 RepID=UPI000A04D47D|nr:M1 family metallopeptidase [Henriciella aquimarina]
MKHVLGFLGVMLLTAVAACGPTPQTQPPDLAELYANAPRGPLPQGVRPTLYKLDMDIDPRQSRFNGTVTIDLDLDRPATGVWLHGQDLQIRDVTVWSPGKEPEDGIWRDVLKSGVAWLGFPRPMGPGQVTVEIDYAAAFDANLAGMFRVDEQGRAYALAKSESIQARRFMPGFDEPRFKAPFDVTLTIPEEDLAIANTPEKTSEPVDDGKTRIAFKRSRPLPTYLLSLAVGPFEKVQGPSLAPNAVREVRIPLTGYTRVGKGEDLSYALMMTEPMVTFFERAFGLSYPYEKLDIVVAPEWPSGATELAAAITYRESRILYGPTSGPAARRSLLNIHSHELAHMWFGDLVTPPWWDDLWLKEAFSSWATGIVLSELEPEGGYGLDALAENLNAMRLDSLNSARAVREPITMNEDIRNAYDSITYDKGQAVIGMVDSYFGAETFRPALGRYLKRFEDSVADSPDFFEVIGEETDEPDLTKAFRSFVEQSGLPTVRAELVCEENKAPTVELAQSRYEPLGSPIEEERRWTIPYCMVTGAEEGAARHCEMIDGRTHSIRFEAMETCPAWIMPNAEGRGYWRFDMPETQWATLAVNFPKLSGGEALTAIDSAMASYEAGGISLSALMAIVNAGAIRPERQVVRQAMRAYGGLAPLTVGDEAAEAGFQAEIMRVFRPRLEATGETDDENDRILRSRLESFLARDGKDRDLRTAFADAARAYVGMRSAEDTRKLTSDDFSTALAIAMQEDGKPFLDNLLDSIASIDDPTFERAAAYAIGENNRPELVDDILELALSQQLGTRENYTIVQGQMRQPETRDRTWAWLQIHYPEFVDIIPGQRPRSTPRLASSLCSAEGIRELEKLFELYGSLAPGHERALSEAIESIQLCMAFRKAKTEDVQTYFARFVPSDMTPESSN